MDAEKEIFVCAHGLLFRKPRFDKKKARPLLIGPRS
jgi:hypothetical protein